MLNAKASICMDWFLSVAHIKLCSTSVGYQSCDREYRIMWEMEFLMSCWRQRGSTWAWFPKGDQRRTSGLFTCSIWCKDCWATVVACDAPYMCSHEAFGRGVLGICARCSGKHGFMAFKKCRLAPLTDWDRRRCLHGYPYPLGSRREGRQNYICHFSCCTGRRRVSSAPCIPEGKDCLWRCGWRDAGRLVRGLPRFGEPWRSWSKGVVDAAWNGSDRSVSLFIWWSTQTDVGW